ncbi:hypothetical protein [Neisseria montereyensis]|uniref:Adhesin n=1 Tax=Neisseria montereyensis TaxID=2973938 RepID=A0ABT2FBW1_9NEIS|nr:hypothetical protein [Neisseria montereyensis]MCS4533647.1 hypothetical protein [Neisseria montereyensis]
MKKISGLSTLLSLLVVAFPLVAQAEHPGFPEIPYTHTITTPATMIYSARVKTQEPRTDGYYVTDPYGESFYVDNLVKPKCVFYGNYINIDDSGNLIGSEKINITTKAYIDQVNIKGCF